MNLQPAPRFDASTPPGETERRFSALDVETSDAEWSGAGTLLLIFTALFGWLLSGALPLWAVSGWRTLRADTPSASRSSERKMSA